MFRRYGFLAAALALGLAACSGKKDDKGGSGGQDDGGAGDTGDGGASSDGGGSGDTGSDTGEPAPQGRCVVVDTESLESFDVAPDEFDFSLRAVLNQLAGTWSGTLVAPGGGDTGAPEDEGTPITVDYSEDALEAAVVHYEWEGPDDAEPEDCPPEYTFVTPTTVTTDDGRFDETMRLTWFASFITTARAAGSIALGTVQGTARPVTIEKGDWGETMLYYQAAIQDAETWTGDLAWGPEELAEPEAAPAGDTGVPPDDPFEIVGVFEVTRPEGAAPPAPSRPAQAPK